jgi:hypothetical protein
MIILRCRLAQSKLGCPLYHGLPNTLRFERLCWAAFATGENDSNFVSWGASGGYYWVAGGW